MRDGRKFGRSGGRRGGFSLLEGLLASGILAFAAAALLFVCARSDCGSGQDRPSLGRWAALGALTGLAMLIRFNSVLWALAPASLWVAAVAGPRAAREGRGERALRFTVCGVVCALAAFVVFSPQLAAWKYMHGAFFSGPRDFNLGQDLHVWQSPNFVNALFSARRGVFFWMPLSVIGVAGWLLRSAVPKPLRLAAPGIFLLNAWMIGAWVMWWAGASFGPRFFIDCLPLVAMGVAAIAERLSRTGRLALRAVVAALVVWNFGLMAQYALRMIDREGDLTYGEVLANQARTPAEIVRRLGDLWRRTDSQGL